MNNEDKESIIKRYNERLEKFGDSIEALASGTEARREVRFQTLLEVGIKNGNSILDVGCGLADFYSFLKSKGIHVDYTGIDLVPNLIDAAKYKYPNLHFEVRDLQEKPYPSNSFDYVICSQVFNFNLGSDKNMDLVEDMINRMFHISQHGVAVDFLTNYVDFRQQHLFYYKPETILSIAKSITRRVLLRHDYPLFEFCLYLYPDFIGWAKE
jgi:ubiquinone/menaquinone biosynthesis C-methylase UbiE